MNKPDRSPLKDRPLRVPGQSLQEERASIWDDKLEPWLLMAVLLVVFAGWEWFRFLSPTPPQPLLISVCAAAVVGFAGWRVFRLRPRLRALRLGIDGERAVGQFLDRLREQGYHAFHDVLADGFNLDHVLIGPNGVFTIETKTWSKPSVGDARISFDGIRILAAGHEPERDPLVQARAQAGWLKTLLTESTGRRFHVQPVVVFPGWFVEATPGAHRAIWVMEPKGLPAFLAREPTRLSGEEIKLAAYHLSRYVRGGERERRQMV